ncbi:MAG: carboxypeptidase-like regulatory domain-containing protein [Oscillospiraceae bacterium]|nr:carboxypeptidase-like regulatory domain-containing protein [Oscillospiraceae bacterium]
MEYQRDLRKMIEQYNKELLKAYEKRSEHTEEPEEKSLPVNDPITVFEEDPVPAQPAAEQEGWVPFTDTEQQDPAPEENDVENTAAANIADVTAEADRTDTNEESVTETASDEPSAESGLENTADFSAEPPRYPMEDPEEDSYEPDDTISRITAQIQQEEAIFTIAEVEPETDDDLLNTYWMETNADYKDEYPAPAMADSGGAAERPAFPESGYAQIRAIDESGMPVAGALAVMTYQQGWSDEVTGLAFTGRDGLTPFFRIDAGLPPDTVPRVSVQAVGYLRAAERPIESATVQTVPLIRAGIYNPRDGLRS